MVNDREHKIMHKHQKEGWKAVRCGAPDFLFIKVKDKEIIDFKFVEVKSPTDKLKPEQHIWKKVLSEKLHAHYIVEVVE